jgi:hypothetical protein
LAGGWVVIPYPRRSDWLHSEGVHQRHLDVVL